MKTSIHMVQCDHAGKPTWAQNDAMLEAYLDNVEYHYRVNDDTRFQTPNWTELFVHQLSLFDPPNVGVVGPRHSGGNTGILTYDFVHRTHVDVLGYYYPRAFTDWFGDNWMTKVYTPGRVRKMKEVRIAHTQAIGRRYKVHHKVQAKLREEIAKGQQTIGRLAEYSESQTNLRYRR